MKSYDFNAKREYRARLWSAVDKCIAKPRALRTVVYLDTSEALESKFLLESGYKAGNMLAVNRSAAEAAWITMRLKRDGYPSVSTAGVEWRSAIMERLKGQRVDVLNFDGMGCLTPRLVDLMRDSVVNVGPRVVCANMLGGREQDNEYGCFIKDLQAREGTQEVRTSFGRLVRYSHLARVKLMLSTMTAPISGRQCWAHVERVSWDVYISSSGQPMVWCVAKIGPHVDIDAEIKFGKTSKRAVAKISGGLNVRVLPACRSCGWDKSVADAASFDYRAKEVVRDAFKYARQMGESDDAASAFAKEYLSKWIEESRGAQQ